MKKLFFTLFLLSTFASISCKSDSQTSSIADTKDDVLVEDTIITPKSPKLQRNILGIVLGETGPTKVKKIFKSEGLEICFDEDDYLQASGEFKFGGYDWNCIICQFKDDVLFRVSLQNGSR